MEELWTNFNPTIGTKDKRDREGVSTHFQSKVSNNLNKLAMVSLTINTVIDVNRKVEGINWSLPDIPNSPLEQFLQEDDNKAVIKGLEAAITKTQLLVTLLHSSKENNDWQKFAELLQIDHENDEDLDKDESDKIPKPEVPVMDQNCGQAAEYHPKLLKALLKNDLTKGQKRLYAGKEVEGDSPKVPATEIIIYDDIAEDILPRNKIQKGKPIYRGRGSGGSGVANSLRLCQAYLLEKLGIDYNFWAKTVDANHKNVQINFESTEDFENFQKTTATKQMKTVLIEDIGKEKKRKRTQEEEMSDDEEEAMLLLPFSTVLGFTLYEDTPALNIR